MTGTNIRGYRILMELARGNMGVVYLAENPRSEKVALKVLQEKIATDARMQERFRREARVLLRLRHRNVLQIHRFMEVEGTPVIVMEYVEGLTLEGHMRRRGGRLTEAEALSIAKGICRGLDHAHRRGIIHRDIKGSNILIRKDGEVKVADFGIALKSCWQRITIVGKHSPGTPWYMSPEQIERPREVDHRTDVYSLGILLYEMVSGRLPFQGGTWEETANMHLKAAFPEIPGQSPRLNNMLRTALQKHPDGRFQGCGEFLRAIEEYMKPEEGGKEEGEIVFPRETPVSTLKNFLIWIFLGKISYEERKVSVERNR